MDNNFPSESDMKKLVKELSQGRELAQQLQAHLINAQPSSSSSHENPEFLLQRILYSYDQALSMLTHNHRPPGPGGEASDSPRSLAGSPHSDDSDHQDQATRMKRNKAVPRWTNKIKVHPEMAIEGQLDDGYSWRKYGQKDILGAKHPRGYYRCTYRHSQGCLAAKQVQRSDDDPTTIEITYKRKHTCNPRAIATNSSFINYINNQAPQNEDPKPPPISNEAAPPFNIRTSLRVITQDLGPIHQISPSSFPPFNLPSSSSSALNPQNNDFFSYGGDNNDILGNFNPISTNEIMNNSYGGQIPNLNHSDSDELSPIVAAMTSTTNSPTLGTDFPFGSSGFGSDFSFGSPGHYP